MKVPTHAERAHIYTQVEAATGPTTAEYLVGMLPTSDGDRLATHKDILLVRKDVEMVRTELRSEIASLGSELRSEITGLGTELRSEIARLGSELRSEITALQASNARWMFTLLITIIAAMAAMYFAP